MPPKRNKDVSFILDSDSDSDAPPQMIQLVPERHIHSNEDGHRLHRYTMVKGVASPVKASTSTPTLLPDLPPSSPSAPHAGPSHFWPEGNPLGDDEGVPVYDGLEEARDPEAHGPIHKEGRALRGSDDPLGMWVRKKKPQLYLDQLVLLEGRGDYYEYNECIHCGVADPRYRCTECFTDDLYCKQCIVETHQNVPLHKVEMWNGDGFFEQTTLKVLGVRIQLGHGLRSKGRRGICINPAPAVDDDFVVIGQNGIHEVGLDFCNCETAQPHDIQLLRARWYPATGKSPRTAITFGALRFYHLLALEAYCSGAEFYNCLARLTDNSGTKPVRDRYDEFLRMARQWRHMQMLKRGGRGHAGSGVDGTKPGELALLCPACPQPEKNLPSDYKNAPSHKRFLYALFLALDANFRMRRKKVSSEEKDPSLGDGWSFFGAIAPYYKYLADNWSQKQERSTCVAHDAVDKPDRESRGTASSGIATVDCARHNMKRPNAVGDLQLGERYINMDYIFFMGLAGSEVAELYVSYDIACQWHKNIWERMKTFDQGVRFRNGQKYCVFLIPKFHLPAHIEACNIMFSFHLTRFVGMTDGEAPERGWASLNPLATSTAEMGPGMRRDTINDAFNDMNHKKIIGLGAWATRRIRDCVPEMIVCSLELEELEDSIRSLDAESVLDEWREEVEAWEEDAANPNPFASRAKQRTVMDVRKELAEEAEADMNNNLEEGLLVSEEMHPSEMIGMGVQLEELQHSLAFDMAGVGDHPTPTQRTNMHERSNKLRRKLLTWMDVQVTHIPHVALLRAEEDRARAKISATQPQPGFSVQHLALWLPSSIKGRAECDRELYECELRLRVAQAEEALEEICHQLLVRTHLYKYKDRFARGVKANTRCQTKIAAVEARIRRSTERYRAARKALVGLGHYLKDSSWEHTIRPLADNDVHGMPRALFQDAERKKQLMKKGPQARQRAAQMRKEAKTAMSWIWRAPGAEQDEEGNETALNEALRLDWLKTRAKFLRRVEEVDLLEEEMRRIPAFLRFQASQWLKNAGIRPAAPLNDNDRDAFTAYAPEHKAYQEGNIAYARRQAARLHQLAQRFEEQWKDIPDFISMGRMALGVVEEEDAELVAVEGDVAPPDELPVPL
ncbi:hypothetical protein FB45DRAFT_1019176 [Roridomyces roridus]|uniref:CxC2-like cysteine cluster KDZ transposase-associated domain-containing protein n=1 Tax=Roridomyces roridus TaxID=1738132 RepID=A0AAD7CEJ7_9AGAR|nr:hypothetical protein FB45DRAFT_1019176 [Roridomyces roridus]